MLTRAVVPPLLLGLDHIACASPLMTSQLVADPPRRDLPAELTVLSGDATHFGSFAVPVSTNAGCGGLGWISLLQGMLH